MPIPIVRGRERRPAFVDGDLNRLEGHYGSHATWQPLRALVDNPFFELVKNVRNGFTHTRRLESELYGEHEVIWASDAQGFRALDGREHEAILLGFYSEIIRPAIAGAGLLLRVAP